MVGVLERGRVVVWSVVSDRDSICVCMCICSRVVWCGVGVRVIVNIEGDSKH